MADNFIACGANFSCHNTQSINCLIRRLPQLPNYQSPFATPWLLTNMGFVSLGWLYSVVLEALKLGCPAKYGESRKLCRDVGQQLEQSSERESADRSIHRSQGLVPQ
ncbi:hypothetical protein EV356DRAFT_218766 [Viridothelium virens]|uniref:Uncharacterized protein n=1 Tax=Viridothelium virens TaxID=1048519 RepID=A0A6A6HLR8_VIRVR|nr:hypothetical protein EV356DRAFT_218766 [Viridothelium virens]